MMSGKLMRNDSCLGSEDHINHVKRPLRNVTFGSSIVTFTSLLLIDRNRKITVLVGLGRIGSPNGVQAEQQSGGNAAALQLNARLKRIITVLCRQR